jgi:hypothetical protein
LVRWSVVRGDELKEAVDLACVVGGLVARLQVGSNPAMQARSRCWGDFEVGEGTGGQLSGAFSRVGCYPSLVCTMHGRVEVQNWWNVDWGCWFGSRSYSDGMEW